MSELASEPVSRRPRDDAALDHATGLVSMYRQTVANDFAEYCVPFANALAALHEAQLGRGLTRPAASTGVELVRVCRRMVWLDPHRHRPALAAALLMAAEDQAEPMAAVDLARESVSLFTEALEHDSDLGWHLVDGLLLLSGLLPALGLLAEAQVYRDRALAAGRRCAASGQRRHRLAMIELLLRTVGQGVDHREALSHCAEAVDRARKLSADDLDAGLPALVRALFTRSGALAAGGQLNPARAAFAEAMRVQRYLPPSGAPSPAQRPQTPIHPAAAFPDEVDAMVAVSDVVCRLSRRGGDPEGALAAWTVRRAALLTGRGLIREAEQVRAELPGVRSTA